ncbi:hypothetical protein CEQ36_02035 [Yersinia intermedia]|jgi:hypothetical protein|nr:hypothetical protein A6J67_12420 [Yersinia sp. FDAARGOS_228]AVL34516.1 hypothetical protein CEQ36_02035 [Yersinia intermedia]
MYKWMSFIIIGEPSMAVARLSAGLLVVGGILGYMGAYWQTLSLLVAAGVALLTGIVLSAFTDRDYR